MEEQLFGEFLFSHLARLSVKHCFGIPGDYILPLYRALEATPGIEAVVATHEPCAAFSADAYARQSGLGVLLVTYGVGGFNAINGVAGAFAEQSPLLVISGGPPRSFSYSSNSHPLVPALHHVVRSDADQIAAYREITDWAVRIEDPAEAAEIIHRAALRARDVKRPVYVEVPTDLMGMSIAVGSLADLPVRDHPADLKQAVSFYHERLGRAKRPVFLAGVEVARHGLQPELRRLMHAYGAPAASTILAKSILPETEPGALGVYAGVLSSSVEVRRIVEDSDLVVMVGTVVTDVNCGAFTADLHRDRLLIAKTGWIGDGFFRIGPPLDLANFVRTLANNAPVPTAEPRWPKVTRFDYARADTQMDGYLAVVEEFLEPQDVVVADTGDACYGSIHLTTQRENGYLASAFYNTMGFAVPAALGAQLANRDCRPVVLVGDGAFQMTGLELSNAVRHRLTPIVLLFNNDGFGMQRIFQDGGFNTIGRWNYTRVTELIGGGRAWRASTPQALRSALAEARAYREGPSLIEVLVAPGNVSTGLQTLGQALMREKTGVCPMAPDDSAPCEHHRKCAFCRAAIWRSC